MDDRVYVVSAIIVATGTLGGLAGHLTQPVPTRGEGEGRAVARSVLLGILAALCVPLFLSLAKSGLMGNIFAPPANPPKPPAFEDYLVFSGLCAIAAISSKRFIDSVTRQVLQRIGSVEERAERAETVASKAERKADQASTEASLGEAADEPNAPPPPEAQQPVPDETDVAPIQRSPITDDERKVLQAMTMRTYRTRTGIAEDSGIQKNRISEMLESLAERKLALPTHSPRTGGARWLITKRGLAALKADTE